MIININDEIIPVEIVLKRSNKNIYYRYKDSKLIITTPVRLSESDILKMIKQNEEAIISLINRVKRKSVEIKETNVIHYLGRELSIEIINDNTNYVSLTENSLVVRTRNSNDLYVKKLIRLFYIESVKKYIDGIFDDIFRMYPDLKRPRPNLVYKYTTSFYGKCYPKKNVIEFSGMCMKLEKKYIDVIIHHEICHFKYLGHQSDFYKYLESHMPNAKKYQHEFRMLKYNDKY